MTVSASNQGNCLIIFARAPRLGTIKTRLQVSMPRQRVRKLYVAFLKDTLDVVRKVRGRHQRIVAFTPSDGESLLGRAIGSGLRGFELRPQHGRDLGARMRNEFEQCFRLGNSCAVILGTDSPSLPSELVEESFQTLAGSDLVLGPSVDGGYYLIGVRSGTRLDFLSADIQWGTERVLEQTIAAARKVRVKTRLLAPWYDVDDVNSLRFLRAHIAALAACGAKDLPKHTWRLLREA